MCGLLLVKSKHKIDTSHHVRSLDLMHHRGPDFTTWRHHGEIFIGQTVLHFSGSPKIYHETSQSCLVFNGEIYDYRKHGDWDSDTRLIKSLVDGHQWHQFNELHGPWAWIWTDFSSVKFATDPQMERHLWWYQDDQLSILCTEIAPIAEYVDLHPVLHTWPDKHIDVRFGSPYKNLKLVEPGVVFDLEQEHAVKLAGFDRWCDDSGTFDGDFDDAVDELDTILREVCQSMSIGHPVSVSLSGGLDSSLLRTYFLGCDDITLAMGDKDPVASCLEHHLVTEELWAQSYLSVTRRLRLPPLSWCWVSYDQVLQHCKTRIMITGAAADELFGGYIYNLTSKISPYSHASQRDMIPDVDQNRLVNDYITQSGSVDLLGVDLVSGLHGIESRTPFAHPRVIKFAISLPYKYKVHENTKLVLRALYHKRTGQEYSAKKMGFAAHCNDSIRFINPTWQSRYDRLDEWRRFVLHDFMEQYDLDQNP